MKKYLITAGVIITILVLGYIYFQGNVSISDSIIPKSQLEDVIINTKEHSYMVTDSNTVLELAKEVSKMKKLNKIDFYNYPPSKDQSVKFIKIYIQTKSMGTIGGSFWNNGNDIVLDSNGYYWLADKDLFDLMDTSLKEAKTLN